MASMQLYAISIFLSAGLLFQVQPLIGKYILPWFGGMPAVWSTCLLFFQLILLVGYTYTHLCARLLSLRNQAMVHLAVLTASILLLPIEPEASWRTTGQENPTWSILALLFATVGGPYFVLSTTAPLLQSWFGATHPNRSPYRLYSLSNLGAMLALITFPTLFEPWLPLNALVAIWTWSYVVFALLCGGCAVRAIIASSQRMTADAGDKGAIQPEDEVASDENVRQTSTQDASWGRTLAWLSFSAVGSILLLATTNHICQDVAPVPFLWVAPLLLYLLTFVLCFDHEWWYHRGAFTWLLIVQLPLAALVMTQTVNILISVQIVMHLALFFTCCMTCHGELVRLKPRPQHLTKFYLAIALGGALGAVFVSIMSPMMFSEFYEYQIGVAGCCILLLAVRRSERVQSRPHGEAGKQWRRFAYMLLFVGFCIFTSQYALKHGWGHSEEGILAKDRNFYGILRIRELESGNDAMHRNVMSHGTTTHGYQSRSNERRRLPTLYYVESSGIGVAINRHPRRLDGKNLRIGSIGLGVGTIASYGNRGDYLRFYEINPTAIEFSNRFFTYQSDAIQRGADLQVFLGDARILLEEQKANQQLQRFDVLAVDAFSSDSIPVHLLTKECFDVYWSHLTDDGILAVHVSNRFLDLSPVVRGIACSAGKDAVFVRQDMKENSEHPEESQTASEWILVTSNKSFLQDETVQRMVTEWSRDPEDRQIWTDDYTNLFQLLR